MRVFLIAVVASLALPAAAVAVPCGPGTLQDYINLDATGCTVGSVTFSEFSRLAIPGGATEIQPTAIGVLPLVGPPDAGLLFDVSVATSAGEFLDARFSFLVRDTLGGATLEMTGSAAGGDGAVTVIEDLCLGAGFVGGVCAAVELVPPLIVFAIEGDSQASATAAFAAVARLGVIADIGVDGGPSGSAALDSTTLLFQTSDASPPAAVAGPAPLMLFMVAGVAAWVRRMTRRSRRQR